MNQGHILMRDTEGWAKLFDLDRGGTDAELAQHYRMAAHVNESPGTPFWLPYDQSVVLPLVVIERTGSFDENDYAMQEVTFTVPGTSEPVAAVSYRIDGRA